VPRQLRVCDACMIQEVPLQEMSVRPGVNAAVTRLLCRSCTRTYGVRGLLRSGLPGTLESSLEIWRQSETERVAEAYWARVAAQEQTDG